MNPNRVGQRKPLDLRRVATIGLVGAVALYVLFVITGYGWVNYGLKNRRITLAQVAFFQWNEVRRDLAVQQLAEANAAVQRKDYAAAYLGFSSAVRNDPDNVEARCAAARFFTSAGAAKVALSLLDAGLDRAPMEPRLVLQLLDTLTATGGDERALEMLHSRFSNQLSGAHAVRFETYEVLATLNVHGAAAARSLLDRYPDLDQNPDSSPIIARVLWETRDRLKAISLLANYVHSDRGGLEAYAQLADWQAAAGMNEDALQTARQAGERFPAEVGPRELLIGVIAPGSPEWTRAVERYLTDFGSRPEAVLRLANLAGERGWVGLARTIYTSEVGRFSEPALLAMAYGDALVRMGQFAEAREVYSELEPQVPESETRTIAAIRERQVVVAAGLGDHDAARAFARRLALAIGDDTNALDAKRRRFAQLNIPEAVAELSRGPRSVATGN